jgi:hypothetical protein
LRDGFGLTYDAGMSSRDEPVCPICSKTIRAGSHVLAEDGALFHVRCRSRSFELAAMEGRERAASAQEGAGRRVGDIAKRRASLAWTLQKLTCPLCRQVASVTDWRPGLDWLVVEGCGCGDFFVAAAIYDHRLPSLSDADRRDLAARIRWFRAKGCEAWCTTADGTAAGTLQIRDERPDQPA